MKKNLRHKIAHVVFLNEFRNKTTKSHLIPFDKAETIGIIYDSTNEAHYEMVRKYVKDLRENFHKDVLALGYFDQNELPTLRFSKLGLDFFTRKDLNWFYKPISGIVKRFVEREFDILIDLHLGNQIPFKYVVASSRAKFKIGKYSKNAVRHYNFMLSVNEQTQLPAFIEQVNHYLKQIKNEK
ncbi:MAG: DUF6913 domain-containing protein [Bacteroidota bacterium]